MKEILNRYATTTCEVAKIQNNSGNMISVEPDFKVWAVAEVRYCFRTSKKINKVDQFQFNKLSHNCAGWSLYGAIGDEDLYFGDADDQNEEGRGMYNRKPNSSTDKSKVVRIKSLSWKEVRTSP